MSAQPAATATESTTLADHLLAELRCAYNLAELATNSFVRDEAYREAARLALVLDRHLTTGGEPPTAWARPRA